MAICTTCNKYYDPEKYPIFLPLNPTHLCAECAEEKLTYYLGEELISEFAKIDRARIEAEENKIQNRWEILDL